MHGNYRGVIMKKRLKRICVSVVSVLVLNIILFSILTVVQAPYYDDAPSQVDSIYELYASEEYNDVVYMSPNGIISDKAEVQRIETALKSVSSVKLNKSESYLRMLLLGKSDFALLTKNSDYGDGKIAKGKLIASNVIVYSKNDDIYILCTEFTEFAYYNGYKEIVIYKTEDSGLAELLTAYKSSEKDGFFLLRPNWRQDISNFPISYNARMYVLSFLVEFVIALIVTRKIQDKQANSKQAQKGKKKK